MQEFIIMLLICSVTMSALALFYMAITPLLSKSYSITSRYYSWLVIVIGLIIPFRPQFSNSIVKIDIPNNTTVPIIQTVAGTPITVPVENRLHSSLPNVFWWQIIVMVWLAGMLIFLAYHVIKHYRFLKLAKRWSREIRDKDILTLIQNLKTQMSLSKNIGLQFCDSIGSPMMIGFVNPHILLPEINFTKDELYFILKHELIHYKRRDIWYKCLVLIAIAIHWFNPIVYLIAKAIDVQCELSCDAEVVRSINSDTREFYIETIIGVVKYQSKLKTALSTNFYGGKKGMKQRIFSIMDMSRKKAGFVVLCSVLTLTLGTGFAFAAKAETESSLKLIKKDISVSFAYEFLPDPKVYAQYSSYGITISDDGKALLYNGQKVRLFVDEYSDSEVFFLDEAGIFDLSVIRNAAGNITGIESISEQKAWKYRSAFFASDANQDSEVQETEKDIIDRDKYEQYSAYGIILSSDGKFLNYNGQRVKLLVDKISDSSFETYWSDEVGTVNLSVVRNETGQITAIKIISEEQAQKYQSALYEYEQNVLNGLDEKIEKKMKELYPEN